MGGLQVRGLTFKLWQMTSTEKDDEDVKTKEVFTFILPEYEESVMESIKSILAQISKVDNILLSLEEESREIDTVEIKQELNLKKELEEMSNKVTIKQDVEGEEEVRQNMTDGKGREVKEEPDFIDDEDAEDDDICFRRKKKKPSRVYQKGPEKKCAKCEKVFVWRKKFQLHLKHCNPEQLKEDSISLSSNEQGKNRQQQGPFYCDRCPQVFQKHSSYTSHIKAHKLSAVLKEGAGGGEVVNPEDQQQLDHLDPEAAAERQAFKLKNRCDTCDLAYSSFHMYKQHMDNFHKKSLSCPQCDLKFTYENTLLKHKLDYHTLYPKKCGECAEVFLTAKTLFEHLDVHTKHLNPKTSPCEICGKLLKDKYTLKAHVEAVHEKRAGGDFACEQCGKMLKSKSSLSYHRKSAHTQDYPHRCDVCGKGFIKYNRMINCLNNHQGIYKYRCPECEYKTNKLIQFKEHVNIHTGEKSYYCPVCRHKSNGTKNLGCHTKQVHKMTLCQAEITYRVNRFGESMTDDQIEDMKVRMSSLSNYNQKILQDLKTNSNSVLLERREAQ